MAGEGWAREQSNLECGAEMKRRVRQVRQPVVGEIKVLSVHIAYSVESDMSLSTMGVLLPSFACSCWEASF